MTMVEGPAGFLLFRDSAALEEPAANADLCSLANGSSDYWRTREQAERAAAKRATSVAARRIHQQLAQFYAGQADGNEGR